MKRKALRTSALVLCVIMAFCLSSCGTEVSYNDYDLSEYIKVGEYKGLEVASYSISVTDDEVESAIQSALEDAATDKELDEGTAVEDGDVVNIDYTGKLDGKKFEGGSAEGYDLTIGSGSFIDGFESGLIGKKVGEKTDLELTFPEDYSSEELQGKDVVFTVKINSATRKEAPALDDDFVKNTTEFETVDEYRADLEKQLYDEKEQEVINNQKMTLWSSLLENVEVKKYPERELDYYIKFNSDQMDTMAKEYDMTRDELLAAYDFGSEDEFAATNEDSSKQRVKQEMLIQYIVQKEGLEYTKKEKDALIKNYKNAGYDEKTIKTQTGRTMDEYVDMELLYGKVLDFLLDNAVITDAASAE